MSKGVVLRETMICLLKEDRVFFQGVCSFGGIWTENMLGRKHFCGDVLDEGGNGIVDLKGVT